MNILLVDDDDRDYLPVKDALKRQKRMVLLQRCGFDDINNMLNRYKVDLLILDLNNGLAGDNDVEAGKAIINNIYMHSFLPIIIYSGYSDEFDNPFKDNYFIKTVKKGLTGIDELKKAIKVFIPFIEEQILLSKEISANISEIYRNTYQKMIKNTKLKATSRKSEIFTRLTKRRLAASIDEASGENRINAWEIYLYPCLGTGYLTGDILRKKGANKNEPSSYRIILSPSCDLQNEREHIHNVKLACFTNIQGNIKKSNLDAAKLRDTSPKQFMFFHKLEGEFPHMICDFKGLEVMDYDKLEKNFERVVSIDSPFRESIVWADITINGRPGLPDRDCEDWIANIKEECYP